MAKSADKRAAWEKWFEPYMKALGDMLTRYETSHPNWFVETVFDLIGDGLRSLRHYIESAKDKEVTWTSPIAEFHYPLEWNWKAWDAGDETAILQVLGQLTRANLGTKTKAVRTLSEIAYKLCNVFVLNTLTNHVGWEKRRKRYVPIFSSDIASALSRLSRSQQQRALSELYRPFSIGAVPVDFDLADLEDDGRIPSRLTRALADGAKNLDFSPLTFNGSIDSQPFKMSLIVQFHPLVVDVGAREAYFPIVVGLVIHPTSAEVAVIKGGRPLIVPISPDPASWSRKDQKAFWDVLLKAWDDARRLLGRGAGSPDGLRCPPVEVLLTARVVPFDQEAHDSIIQRVLESLGRQGRLEHVTFDLRPAAGLPGAVPAQLEHKIASGSFDVFLAHNSRDRPAVKRVAEHLKRRGIYPWVDDEQVPPGRRFQKQLQQAICHVRSAAVFIGASGVGPWQDLELETFVQECVRKKLPVIPVLLPGLKEIPRCLLFLRGFTQVRFDRTVDEVGALDQLEWGITGQKPATLPSQRRHRRGN
jgi:hypothetical protein